MRPDPIEAEPVVDNDRVRELFDEHVGLADRLARRYSFGGRVDDDLRQVAQIGLLLAARRFDPDLGVFVRYATVTIIGELKKHLRSHGWGVRVPRSLQEDSITVASARDRLTGQLGRAPTVHEVARHTGFEPERVTEAIRTRESRFTTSIEQIGLDYEDATSSMDLAIVAHALGELPEDMRGLIEYRYRDGLTQAEIGRLIGVSQPQVHRRLTHALEQLRRLLEVSET